MSERLESCFIAARNANRIALMPYFTGGYPDEETCIELLLVAQEVGSDAIELGIPFSDPLADGPTIQAASQVALDRGVTPGSVLDLLARARSRGLSLPVTLMSYLNPIHCIGMDAFARRAAQAGADGIIIPDLPAEEAAEVVDPLRAAGLATVFLAAPTTHARRLRSILAHCRGFLYYVSLTGVTGARTSLHDSLEARVTELRNATDLPVCVGFGISTPEHVRRLEGIADGAIVGSALIDRLANASGPREAIEAARTFLRELIRA